MAGFCFFAFEPMQHTIPKEIWNDVCPFILVNLASEVFAIKRHNARALLGVHI